MEVLDNNFIVITIVNEILLTLFNQFNEFSVLFIFFVMNEMLKQLEKESSIEAISISTHASYLLELRIDVVKAVFKFVVMVFMLEYRKV